MKNGSIRFNVGTPEELQIGILDHELERSVFLKPYVSSTDLNAARQSQRSLEIEKVLGFQHISRLIEFFFTTCDLGPNDPRLELLKYLLTRPHTLSPAHQDSIQFPSLNEGLIKIGRDSEGIRMLFKLPSSQLKVLQPGLDWDRELIPSLTFWQFVNVIYYSFDSPWSDSKSWIECLQIPKDLEFRRGYRGGESLRLKRIH